ncbi:MAG: hypothetical protein NVS1B4_21380 [Gemmatimonadaceae bacterium]
MPYAPPPQDTARRNGATPAWTLPPAALRVAGYAALVLYLELAIIRYAAGYVRVFGFFLNFVLIAAFLGTGVGMLRSRQQRQVRWIAPFAFPALAVAVAMFAVIPIDVPRDTHEYLWNAFAASAPHHVSLLTVVVVLFTLCATLFVPLGAQFGAEFGKLPPLVAYSADIAGALLGVLGFALMSALRLPPTVWFAVGLALWTALALPDRRFAIAMAAATVATLTVVEWTRDRPPEYWSPYYRINLRPEGGAVRVDVNGALHQYILDFDSTSRERTEYVKIAQRGYLHPYALAARLDTALVVGAGTGNDIAMLLSLGARHIDAVEIDPVIAGIGALAHPQQPYADPRVHLHVNDARAYLRRASQRYDVIVFGTLDSQTLLSGMSSVRLDNYVYTVESFRSARARLKPDGTMIVYHLSGLPYIAARLTQIIREAFDAPPRVFADHAMLFNHTFVAGYGARGATNADLPADLTAPLPLAHDDWPYLYLAYRTIPAHYLTALAAVLAIAALFVGLGAPAALRGGVDGAMFFLGAGFMLVETKSVTEMSLLFGSTWVVNVLVFTSILVTILVANVAVMRTRRPRLDWLFGGLFASLAIAWATPASTLLRFGHLAEWGLGGALVALPIFFAALIFGSLLRVRTDHTRALAYNVLGAIVGGVLEYSSMATGIKGLYLVAAAAYGAAYLCTRVRGEGLAVQRQ